jgi:hypothetical protein
MRIMSNAVPKENHRRYRVALIAVLAVALLAVGFECYGRWVARNMATIVKAGVEAPRAANWSSVNAPENSVVLLAGDTVAEVTGVLTFKDSVTSRQPKSGFLAVLTDSTAGSLLVRDSSQVAVMVQDTPIILRIQKKQVTDTLPVARLWIVELPRFIPVYPGGSSGSSVTGFQ